MHKSTTNQLHISWNVRKGYFVQLRAFRWARRYLTIGTSILVANVIARLNYSKSFYRSLLKFNLHKLCLQSSVILKLVQLFPRFSHWGSQIFWSILSNLHELLQFQGHYSQRCKYPCRSQIFYLPSHRSLFCEFATIWTGSSLGS